jgi:hypothetical protein
VHPIADLQNYWRDLRRHDWRSPIAACLDCHAEDDSMRVLIALLVIAYLVGVGVALAPAIKGNCDSDLAAASIIVCRSHLLSPARATSRKYSATGS